MLAEAFAEMHERNTSEIHILDSMIHVLHKVGWAKSVMIAFCPYTKHLFLHHI